MLNQKKFSGIISFFSVNFLLQFQTSLPGVIFQIFKWLYFLIRRRKNILRPCWNKMKWKKIFLGKLLRNFFNDHQSSKMNVLSKFLQISQMSENFFLILFIFIALRKNKWFWKKPKKFSSIDFLQEFRQLEYLEHFSLWIISKVIKSLKFKDPFPLTFLLKFL